TESGMDQVTFDQLDTNRDGVLDAGELARWQERPADLELILRLGKTRPGELPADTYPPAGRVAPLAGRVAKPSAGVLLLTLGNAQIDVQQSGTGVFQARFPLRDFFLQQF